MVSFSQINPLKKTKLLLSRYNLVIFIVLVACYLIAVITIVTSILSQPSITGTGGSSNFDQATINRLGQFESSKSNTNYKRLPAGRINPFFE